MTMPNRWEPFSRDELSMIIGAVRRASRSRLRIVDEFMHGPMAPMLREISKELRRRDRQKPEATP